MRPSDTCTAILPFFPTLRPDKDMLVEMNLNDHATFAATSST